MAGVAVFVFAIIIVILTTVLLGVLPPLRRLYLLLLDILSRPKDSAFCYYSFQGDVGVFPSG